MRAVATQKGEFLQISIKGCVQFFEANAALNAGTKVSHFPATPGRVDVRGANPKFGTLLDKAKAEGDLVRVFVDPDKA